MHRPIRMRTGMGTGLPRLGGSIRGWMQGTDALFKSFLGALICPLVRSFTEQPVITQQAKMAADAGRQRPRRIPVGPGRAPKRARQGGVREAGHGPCGVGDGLRQRGMRRRRGGHPGAAGAPSGGDALESVGAVGGATGRDAPPLAWRCGPAPATDNRALAKPLLQAVLTDWPASEWRAITSLDYATPTPSRS
jgi:hypothetical protein